MWVLNLSKTQSDKICSAAIHRVKALQIDRSSIDARNSITLVLLYDV